jgi:hypothetical protein
LALVAAGVGTASGLWMGIQSSRDLYDRYTHGQSMSPLDMDALADYFGAIGGIGGGFAFIGKAARGARLGKTAAFIIGGAHDVAAYAGAAGLVQQGGMLIKNWKDLSYAAQWKGLLQVFAFGGLTLAGAARPRPTAETPRAPVTPPSAPPTARLLPLTRIGRTANPSDTAPPAPKMATPSPTRAPSDDRLNRPVSLTPKDEVYSNRDLPKDGDNSYDGRDGWRDRGKHRVSPSAKPTVPTRLLPHPGRGGQPGAAPAHANLDARPSPSPAAAKQKPVPVDPNARRMAGDNDGKPPKKPTGPSGPPVRQPSRPLVWQQPSSSPPWLTGNFTRPPLVKEVTRLEGKIASLEKSLKEPNNLSTSDKGPLQRELAATKQTLQLATEQQSRLQNELLNIAWEIDHKEDFIPDLNRIIINEEIPIDQRAEASEGLAKLLGEVDGLKKRKAELARTLNGPDSELGDDALPRPVEQAAAPPSTENNARPMSELGKIRMQVAEAHAKIRTIDDTLANRNLSRAERTQLLKERDIASNNWRKLFDLEWERASDIARNDYQTFLRENQHESIPEPERTRYLGTASHMIGYTKDNPNINLPDAINQGIRRLDNEITVQTHKHYELLDTGASPEAIEFCARDLREIMTLKMLLEEQRAAFIEGNFLRSGGPINEIELQNLRVTAEKEIAKLQDLTTPLNVDQFEPARAALHKYNEAVKKAGEHAPAEHAGALKDLTEKLSGLQERAPTPSIGDTLRDTLRPEVVAKMDAAIRDSGARAEALDVKRAQRRGPTDIDLARGGRLAEQAMNAAKDPRSSGDERQNALESILDFLDEVNLGDDHAPKAHQDLAKKLNIALDALEDFGGPLDMSDKEIDDVLHRHDKIAAAGGDLRALRPPTPKSLRGTLPPDIAKMDAEILGRDKAAELFDRKNAQNRKIAPDQPGPNLAKLREAAVNAMLRAENIVSVEEFDEAVKPVLDYLEEVDSPDAHVPQVHQDLAESLGKKLAAIQIARGDDDSNIDMIKEIGYSDPHFTENPPRQSSARAPEDHHKIAAEAYDKFRNQRKLSDGEKQRIVDRLNHMIILKPGMSDAKILVEMDALKERLDRRIVNFFKAGTATPEAIANLDEAMVLKMVLEEEIAKHNANLN